MTAPLTDHSLSGVGSIAQAILDGSTTLLSGARQIAQLAIAHHVALDEDFAPFVIFDDRTFDLPSADARKHWAADALAQKDAQLAAIESKLRPQALAACRRLIARCNLGELATLKTTLASYFNQDWSADSESEEEVWREIVRSNPRDYLERLVEQIDALLGCSDDAISEVLRKHADGISFDTPAEARRFLEVFETFVRTYGVPD